VVFAAPRLDVQELRQISENLKLKYGPEFIADAMANRYHTVNEKVVAKLTMSRPPKAIVDSFLVEIAAEYNVDWQPADGIVTMSDSLGSPAPPEVPDVRYPISCLRKQGPFDIHVLDLDGGRS
jgi:hypothetical protein